MGAPADRLGDVFAQEDLDAFIALMDPDVSWTWWEPEPACRNRDEVRARIEEVIEEGVSARPEVVAAAGDRVVVDPHVEPPPDIAPELHHVYTFRDGRIVRMEDFPDRKSALEAVGLE